MMKRLRLIQTPWFGVYLHFIYREDLDPVPHDHPWVFWRIVLRGWYHEIYLRDAERGPRESPKQAPWRPSKVPTSHAHRITYVCPGTVSLVLVGPKIRTWGFWTPEAEWSSETGTRTWVDYRDALHLRPTEGSRSQHPGRSV